jgi:ATP-dependent Clp protease ATP-binding subunit ClpA
MKHEHDGDAAQKGGATMFERFTDQARRVLVLAQEEARIRDCRRVGTEHLLLGLIHEREGMAAEALESMGISLEAVRGKIEEITGQSQEMSGDYHQYTLRAKKALDLSRREALQLGHNHIGTEHILLSLIREGEGPAAQVLLELGADLGRVRQQVIELLARAQAEVQAEEEEGEPPAEHAAPRPSLTSVGENAMLAEILSRIEDMDSRLAAVEQQMGPGPDLRELDRQITQARQAKESAAGAEDYENAVALRNKERQLVADKAARQKEWATSHLDLPSLAEGLHLLSDEVGRLRGLLTQQGLAPRGGVA